MSAREDDAKALAERMGWEYNTPGLSERWFRTGGPVAAPGCGLLYLPAPEAPLPEHLAFVGRIAETLAGWEIEIAQSSNSVKSLPPWMVKFKPGPSLAAGTETHIARAPDLAHATIRAALAAKGAT